MRRAQAWVLAKTYRSMGGSLPQAGICRVPAPPSPQQPNKILPTCAGLRFVSSSSTTSDSPPRPPAAVPTNGGAAAYQSYLEACDKVLALQEEIEQKKSKELYDAWLRASEAERSPKSTGVAVIRTLAKQQHRTKKTEEEVELAHWKERMEQALVEAAERYQHPTALVQLGNKLLGQANQACDKKGQEETVKEHLFHALKCYEQSCKLGSPEGCFNEGNLRWTGWPPADDDTDLHDNGDLYLVPDRKAAMNAFHRAIELGDIDSMYFVGVQLMSEDEGHQDEDETSRKQRLNQLSEGLQYIEKAADRGHPKALYYLAVLHYNGHSDLGVIPCSPTDFVQRLNAAVDANDADALFLRGHSYYHGESGYSVNYARALDDFLAAADAEHADAAVSAGVLLHQPHPGVEQDQHKAFQLYQRAGELGSKDGWRNVVACYLSGEGVPQSLETAKYIVETMLKGSEMQDTST